MASLVGNYYSSIKGAFRLYDIDQNGSVTKDEMIQMINAIVAMTGVSDDMQTENRVTKIFEMMDTVYKLFSSKPIRIYSLI